MRVALAFLCAPIVPVHAFADTSRWWATVDDYDRPLPLAKYHYHRVAAPGGR